MKRIFLLSKQPAFLFVVSLLAASCNPNEIAVNKAASDKKAVGRWQLVGITSGWTGKTNLPAEKVELTIDQQLQGVLYENNKQVLTHQYVLEETSSGTVRYSITQQTGRSTIFYLPAKGNFRVSTNQLIIGDTGVDGNDYSFARE